MLGISHVLISHELGGTFPFFMSLYGAVGNFILVEILFHTHIILVKDIYLILAKILLRSATIAVESVPKGSGAE